MELSECCRQRKVFRGNTTDLIDRTGSFDSIGDIRILPGKSGSTLDPARLADAGG